LEKEEQELPKLRSKLEALEQELKAQEPEWRELISRLKQLSEEHKEKREALQELKEQAQELRDERSARLELFQHAEEAAAENLSRFKRQERGALLDLGWELWEEEVLSSELRVAVKESFLKLEELEEAQRALQAEEPEQGCMFRTLAGFALLLLLWLFSL